MARKQINILFEYTVLNCCGNWSRNPKHMEFRVVEDTFGYLRTDIKGVNSETWRMESCGGTIEEAHQRAIALCRGQLTRVSA